jgi:hypothetical protein
MKSNYSNVCDVLTLEFIRDAKVAEISSKGGIRKVVSNRVSPLKTLGRLSVYFRSGCSRSG